MVQSADEPETAEDLEFIQNESKLVMERLQVYSIKCLCIYLFGNKMFQITKEKNKSNSARLCGAIWKQRI
jgi:hypothetical protein